MLKSRLKLTSTILGVKPRLCVSIVAPPLRSSPGTGFCGILNGTEAANRAFAPVDDVLPSVSVGLSSGVGLGVGDGVGLGLGVGDGVGLGLGVGDGVGEVVGSGLGDGVGPGVFVGVGDGFGVFVGDGLVVGTVVG